MPSDSVRDEVTIRHWTHTADKTRWIAALDRIFFEASPTKAFADAAARAAFRERWLGRYLTYAPDYAYLAIDPKGALAGYLVGCIEDASTPGGFADLDDFEPRAELAALYPAHLHVNLASAYRNRGIGAELIAAFARDVSRAGARGMHVVTAAGARNIGFYERNGFREVARALRNEKELVLLGRDLAAPETA